MNVKVNRIHEGGLSLGRKKEEGILMVLVFLYQKKEELTAAITLKHIVTSAN